MSGVVKKRISIKKIAVCSKSMEEIRVDCEKWAKEIKRDYKPDLIIFIAKSGFLFAEPMAKVMGCDLADILAFREASEKKDKLKKIIRLAPEKLVLQIIKSPLMYRFNERKTKRNVCITKKFEKETKKEHRRILIVDDSVDTGWSLQSVLIKVYESF